MHWHLPPINRNTLYLDIYCTCAKTQALFFLYFILTIAMNCNPLRLILNISCYFSFSITFIHYFCCSSMFAASELLAIPFSLKNVQFTPWFFSTRISLYFVYIPKNHFTSCCCCCCILVKIEFHVNVISILLLLYALHISKAREKVSEEKKNSKPKINRQTKIIYIRFSEQTAA